MPKRKDLRDRVFGRLTVLRFARVNERRELFWECRCVCGTVKEVRSKCLLEGKTQSCGCLVREVTVQRSTKHGEASRDNQKRTSEYKAWRSMRGRCYVPSTSNFKNYGGRGITVCAEWQGPEGFANFIAYMGQKPVPELTLERINVNGNYGPGNCCWATKSWQRRNQRRCAVR